VHGPRLGRFAALGPVDESTELGRAAGCVRVFGVGHTRDSSWSRRSAAGISEIILNHRSGPKSPPASGTPGPSAPDGRKPAGFTRAENPVIAPVARSRSTRRLTAGADSPIRPPISE